MATPTLDVLVIDDEKNIRMTLVACLEALGCRAREAATAQAALQAAAAHRFDLCFLDLRLGQDDGLALLPQLLAAHPGLEVVLVTAYATVDTAVQAIQKGARDYLAKPFTPAQIRHVIEQLRARRALEREVDGLRAQLAGTSGDEAIVESTSPAMRDVLAILDRVAPYDVPLLLLGENGTGKSALAHRVHVLSPRAKRPFIAVACPTLSEELLASELFGHVKGAFTGAVADRAGRVEAAEGGTLFLDEIGELPPSLQAKLLQFVQEHTFERVGESRSRTADVRIIAATNRDLDAEVRAGRFREDLLYRLNTVEVRVPPLRDRREDILPLARHFLAAFERHSRGRSGGGARSLSLSPEAEGALVAHGWPGNVRELKNAMERAAILAPGVVVGPELLPSRIAEHAAVATPFVGGDFSLDEIERAHIESVLARTATQDEAARTLGIDASTLWRKKKRYEGA